MKLHRYQYLYLPVSKFFSQLSPQAQTLLTLAKVTLICLLLGFSFMHTAHLG